MNESPRPANLLTCPMNRSPDIQDFLACKTQNFVGRQFVFEAIHTFMSRYSRGYFTIVGFPGMGKSAILSQYVCTYPQTFFYPCELDRYHQSEMVLEDLFRQLIQTYSLSYANWPENATNNGWFLSVLLQEISDLLAADERLIIAIDGCERIDCSTQSLGSNLLYLPRYLPNNVYILLTRRPFIAEQSGLLVETPHQFLDLSQYSGQNQQDIQAYLRLFNVDAQLTQTILNQSQSNFKYTITTLAKADLLPRLTDYYQSHWQQMRAQYSSELSLRIIDCWSKQNEWISCEAIALQLDEDEYEIQLILENWIEFIQVQERESEIYYRWYHSHFCSFLKSIPHSERQNIVH